MSMAISGSSSWDTFNDYLEEQCLQRQDDILRGHKTSIGERLKADLAAMQRFEMEVLHGALKDALRIGAVSFDAIKHLVLCRVEHRPPRLDLDIYPFLPRMNVATTSASSYMSLLSGGSS